MSDTQIISKLEEKIGGRVVLKPFDNIDYQVFGDLREQEERFEKERQKRNQQLKRKVEEILSKGAVSQDGVLDLENAAGAVNIKINGDYNVLGGGGQYVVLEGRLDDDKLSYDTYGEIWCNMHAFELLEATPQGSINKKATFYNEAKKKLVKEFEDKKSEVAERLGQRKNTNEVREKAEEERKKELRKEIYEKLGRNSLVPNGKCAVKLAKETQSRDPSVIKESLMWGFNNDTSVDTVLCSKTVGRPVFMMEYIENPLTLRQIVEETTTEEKIDLVLDVIKLLRKIDNIGGVHRDIKPPNLFVYRGENGKLKIKLGDYGVIRIREQDGSAAQDKTYSRGVMSVGTPKFFSPEHVNSPENMTIKADLYSLFATLYVWLTGKTPNPINSTGYADTDAQSESVNVALQAIHYEKMKPVNPYNAADKKVIYSGLRLHQPERTRLQRAGRFIADPWQIFAKGKLKKQFYELSLVVANGLMFAESERYGLREAEEDFKAVKEHRQASHVRAALDEKIQHYAKDGRLEDKLRKTSPGEYMSIVFSDFDPGYDKAMKNPIVQRNLRKKGYKYAALTTLIAGAAAVASSYATKWVIDNAEWLSQTWTKIKDIF